MRSLTISIENSDIKNITILAIKIHTALKCHNLPTFDRREVISFFKIRIFKKSIKWDHAGSRIFIRLEMRAEWRKHLLFASVVGKFLYVYGR